MIARMGALELYVDMFPDDPKPRRTPMDGGGKGSYFVYLTNRNQCSYLFSPRAIDNAFFEAASLQFPMGYSTLFVLELLSSSKVDRSESLSPRTPEFCVFTDPARTNMGSGATRSFHPTHEEAIAEVQRLRKESIRAVTTRVIDRMSWH